MGPQRWGMGGVLWRGGLSQRHPGGRGDGRYPTARGSGSGFCSMVFISYSSVQPLRGEGGREEEEREGERREGGREKRREGGTETDREGDERDW